MVADAAERPPSVDAIPDVFVWEVVGRSGTPVAVLSLKPPAEDAPPLAQDHLLFLGPPCPPKLFEVDDDDSTSAMNNEHKDEQE